MNKDQMTLLMLYMGQNDTITSVFMSDGTPHVIIKREFQTDTEYWWSDTFEKWWAK